MSNPYFQFKQFTIWHDQCAMRVNTDGVLLGAWTKVAEPRLILDIGTGTGLLALMLAQRSKAVIHAIEIEENAYKQALWNVDNSPWKNRIQIIHDDFCDYYKTSSFKYDMIITNPPYFSNSLKNSKINKTFARHNDALPFESLLNGVSSLLSNEGVFSVILPCDAAEFENEASIYGLHNRRSMLIRSLPDKKFIRQMIEFSSGANAPEFRREEISIYQQPGIYSTEYKDLTKEFYLNF